MQERVLSMGPLAMELLTPELLDDLSSQHMITLENTVGSNSHGAACMLFHTPGHHAHMRCLAQEQNSCGLQICEQPGSYLVSQPLLYLQLPTVHSSYGFCHLLRQLLAAGTW